jgi:hypothetical protein
MNKFDQIISVKLGQLTEAAPGAVTPTAGQPVTPGQAPTPQTAGQPTAQAATPPAAGESPEQQLTKVFQTLKFSDAQNTLKALNTAAAAAGKVPGIQDFFSSLTYDPQKGFNVVKQAAAAPQAGAAAPAAAGQPAGQTTAPGTTPLK